MSGFAHGQECPAAGIGDFQQAIRRHKPDPRDASHIARVVKNGEGRPAAIPGEKAMSCRQATRRWYALMANV